MGDIGRFRVRYILSRHHPRTRVIQYSRPLVMESRGRGVLDAPPEPVIRLAEGETRWRSMTVVVVTLIDMRRDGIFASEKFPRSDVAGHFVAAASAKSGRLTLC